MRFANHLVVEANVHVLAETTRVVIANSLGITERLEDLVGLEQLVLDLGDRLVVDARRRNELEYVLARLGLARARLATDQYALVAVLAQHAPVGIVSD